MTFTEDPVAPSGHAHKSVGARPGPCGLYPHTIQSQFPCPGLAQPPCHLGASTCDCVHLPISPILGAALCPLTSLLWWTQEELLISSFLAFVCVRRPKTLIAQMKTRNLLPSLLCLEILVLR